MKLASNAACVRIKPFAESHWRILSPDQNNCNGIMNAPALSTNCLCWNMTGRVEEYQSCSRPSEDFKLRSVCTSRCRQCGKKKATDGWFDGTGPRQGSAMEGLTKAVSAICAWNVRQKWPREPHVSELAMDIEPPCIFVRHAACWLNVLDRFWENLKGFLGRFQLYSKSIVWHGILDVDHRWRLND